MKHEKLTPFQKGMIRILLKGNVVSTSMVQQKLRCSFLKACELIDFAEENGYISHELPRTVNHEKIQQLLKSKSI